MRLIGDFFDIVGTESTEAGLVWQVRLNPDHYIFRAHFPGNPMTPGVCLVQMATELLEEKYHCPFRLRTAVNIRFKKPIGNDQLLTFRFTKVVIDGDQASIGVSIEDETTPCVKMSLKYMVNG